MLLEISQAERKPSKSPYLIKFVNSLRRSLRVYAAEEKVRGLEL